MHRIAITPPTSRSRVLVAAAVVLIAAATLLAALAAAGAPAGAAAAAGPTTHFSGQITGASGRYGNLRGTVRIVLHAATVATVTPGPAASPRPLGFTMTITAPPCSAQHVNASRRCASLHGSVTGTALAAPHIPDVGTTFVLSGHGRVAPLGAVSTSGTTHSLGFIAHGRFPLTLSLRTAHGRITVTAQGPLVNGFSSPF